MKQYEIMAISNRITEIGIKQIRKVGHTLEFDQIRQYNRGDDYRTINWKATARKSELMVNQFQDERSQQIYSLIDLGRTMKMPFEGMTLLDYAINSAVVLSNIALVKHDKPGLLTFSNVPSVIIPASAKRSQMQLILEALHSQNTVYPESDIESLYEIVRRTIKQRSLIMLYTNFETLSSMNRWRKHLNAIAKSHLLLVVFFKNTELFGILSSKSQKVSDIYAKVMAEKLVFEKRNIVKELNKQGILTILSEPQELTVNALNKYLEIKSRRLL